MGTALAMAKGTSGVGSAGGADKATVAASEVLGPRAYGRVGGEVQKASTWRGLAWDRCRKRASECPLSRKECEGPPRAGLAEGGYVRTWEGCGPVKGTHLWRP